jgi:hypothetical protein
LRPLCYEGCFQSQEKIIRFFNFNPPKEHKMKRIALVAALLTLALTACGQKAAETAAPAAAPAVSAPEAAPAASAPAAAPAADAMKK